MIDSLCALSRVYAEHVGLPKPSGGLRGEVSRRLAIWPFWARWGAGLAAWCVRWIAPAALLGRARSFDGLVPEDREALLERLQRMNSPFLRGAFLLVKSQVLGVCYSARARS